MIEQLAPRVPAPWHAGEIRVQRSVGVAEQMAVKGPRVIRDFLLDQHRDFYAQLPFVVLGSVDPAGDIWATLATGRPGFVSSPDPRRLTFDHVLPPDDPAAAGVAPGDAVGLLGIELHTRRRNRLNGRIAMRDGSHFSVEVEHSFGNCPQYIQQRDFEIIADHSFGPVHRCAALDERARGMIAAADTFFVASYADDSATGRQVDASHRGGKAGLVRVGDDGVLTIPDFAGNLHFNTLGNFLLNPRAGLLFIDFATGDVLQMSGRAEVVLESPEIVAFQGAERLWTFVPDKVVLREAASAVRWRTRAGGWSPHSLMTGDWEEARARLDAARFGQQWRRFRIAATVSESSVIRSFVLEPEDGGGLIPHLAGQHLPIRVTPKGADKPLLRTYTLSTAPSDKRYRISVRKQGLVSAHLHDALGVGDVIEARAPAGNFTIDALQLRPAVLLAAGVGITSMLAMLRHILYEVRRLRRIRRTWLFQAARTAAERAFDAEIADLVAASNGQVTLVRVLNDKTADPAAFDVQGRIDLNLLKAKLPFDGYDFYLCGPPPFMQTLYDGLRDLNVADARIHAEAFGPASMTRRPDVAANPAAVRRPAEAAVPIAFAKSAKQTRWRPGDGTLLELAEARGLTPEFSCRSGSCGTCKVKVLAGRVAYPKAPAFDVADDEALLCCAVPADGQDPSGRLILDV
jgi:ferredoxin-NADP reductase/predicted pyridoxine 5'-phosphate oxidase superfamily flavin-nucleotide-binding protein